MYNIDYALSLVCLLLAVCVMLCFRLEEHSNVNRNDYVFSLILEGVNMQYVS